MNTRLLAFCIAGLFLNDTGLACENATANEVKRGPAAGTGVAHAHAAAPHAPPVTPPASVPRDGEELPYVVGDETGE